MSSAIVVDVMGDTKLKLIAHELLKSVRSNATIDWHHSEMVRAKIRVAVKSILKKYGYPPDLQSEAIQTVLQQVEAFSEKWLYTLILCRHMSGCN